MRPWPASAKRASRTDRLSRFARAVHSRSQLENVLRFCDGQNKNMNTEQTKLTQQARCAVLDALGAAYHTTSLQHNESKSEDEKRALRKFKERLWVAWEVVATLETD